MALAIFCKSLDWNFRPSASQYQAIEKRLAAIQEVDQLEGLFAGVMRSKDVDEFLGLFRETVTVES